MKTCDNCNQKMIRVKTVQLRFCKIIYYVCSDEDCGVGGHERIPTKDQLKEEKQ